MASRARSGTIIGIPPQPLAALKLTAENYEWTGLLQGGAGPDRAFTLVELLVVIAIIGILVALLLPAIQAVREAARRSQCTNNLRQVGIAVLNYEDSYKELPWGSSYGRPDTEGRFGTWVVAVMPFLEEQAIESQWDYSKAPNVAPNVQLAATVTIDVLICPTDEQSSQPILDERRPGQRQPPVRSRLMVHRLDGANDPGCLARLPRRAVSRMPQRSTALAARAAAMARCSARTVSTQSSLHVPGFTQQVPLTRVRG